MTDERFGPAASEDVPEIARIMSWSFGFPKEHAEPWLGRAGIDNVRALRRGARIEACLIAIPHAQFFGGKRVPAVGVAGVATPAETRGSGAAVAMMKGLLRELHERGVATSNLYPASLPLYRRVGYEVAGARYEVKAPLAILPRTSRAMPLREMAADERPAVEACYREVATTTNGWLDRGPYVWQRVFEPRNAHARAFVVGPRDAIEGYVVFYQKHGTTTPNAEYSLIATDLVARTPAAVGRLFTLLADHGTLADTITWYGAPNDALVHALPAVDYAVRVKHPWMIRLVDVPKALAARGWRAGLKARLELEIEDDLLDANRGKFVLDIDDGRASVERGGRGTFALDVRALAALFTAHMTPRALATAGVLRAEPGDLARAELMFGAATPSLVDFF